LTRVYLDSNILLYAVGEQSRYREPCRDVLRRVASRSVVGETSILTVQEVVHHRQRRGDVTPASHGRQVLSICSATHPLDESIGLTAMALMDDEPELQVSDAMHAATALRHGISLVVSADDDFDGIPGIARIDPLDRTRLAALTSQ
jgi:predicted nucleic acid-binding protein